MRVADLLLARRPNFSFEFFPPQDDAGVTALFDTIAALLELDPGFVSVTYGAGGSTRRLTVDLVERIQRELAITPVAHLTCVGSTRAELHAVLGRIVDAGIENVLALRGDPPGARRPSPRRPTGSPMAPSWSRWSAAGTTSASVPPATPRPTWSRPRAPTSCAGPGRRWSGVRRT